MINLSKGQKVAIDNAVNYAMVGLGWDTNHFDNGSDFDLDASIFLLDANDKLSDELNFVFYNNLTDPAQCVCHSGDNRVGDSEGDDEMIFIDFTKIPANIQKLAVVVTIHDAEERRQNFGQVNNAYIRLVKTDTFKATAGVEELRFDLSEDYSTQTSMLMAEIYRHNGTWKFAARGDGYNTGLADFVLLYGGQVQ